MLAVDFSSCVSNLEPTMPATIKVFLPSEQGAYPGDAIVTTLWYRVDSSDGIEEIFLDELVKKPVGSLTGHAICALSLGDPLIKEIEERVIDEGFSRAEFEAFEVEEHTAERLRGWKRFYKFKDGALEHVAEGDEGLVIISRFGGA